ncbi:MAG: hypothetical protein WBX20_01815 [Terrimicrobiaceae bacterium]
MHSFFAELGRTVLALWKQENFASTAFPRIAQCALDERPPANNVDLAGLIREFLLEDEQPLQTLSGFGQPELIVYDNPRFYIQLLFWLDGTTDIHQHEFSGAFHVLAGSSIHSHFEFENAQPITAHLQVGDLRLKDTRLLETGCTVPIVSGRSCIHSLFHLDTPSVTVVVRTHSDPGTGPQFTYLPPHVAVDPDHNDALTMRRKHLLDVLERISDPDYAELVLAMVGELDFERGFFILQNGIGALRSLGAWEETLDAFAQKHGALARFVAPTLEEIIRRDAIAALRGSIEEVEHRFFLALLLNVPCRAGVLEMVGRRYPGQPIETVLRWANELREDSEAGTWILDAGFPEELGVAEEEQPEIFLTALRYFVAGGEVPAVLEGLPAEDVATLRETFLRSSLRALVLEDSPQRIPRE